MQVDRPDRQIDEWHEGKKQWEAKIGDLERRRSEAQETCDTLRPENERLKKDAGDMPARLVSLDAALDEMHKEMSTRIARLEGEKVQMLERAITIRESRDKVEADMKRLRNERGSAQA